MKRLIILACLILFAGVQSVQAADPIETGTFNDKAIYGYDTVAYFTQNKAVRGDDSNTYKWRGATWYFVSDEHKQMFVADPLKYAPQFGGYCAYAMSDERFVGIDEDAFTIYQNKLYLNYSNSVMNEWRANKDEFIQQAEAYYNSEFKFADEIPVEDKSN